MFTGIHHICYHVQSLDETIKQYQALYQGKVEVRWRNEPGQCEVAFVKFGDARVELVEPDDKSTLGGSKAQVLHHIGYLVDDIEKARDELKAKGVNFFQKMYVNALGCKIAYFDAGDCLGRRQHLTQE
jgi:catechol 2,3-dioxygenase-like lactoylglutathione lyase family enzyme